MLLVVLGLFLAVAGDVGLAAAGRPIRQDILHVAFVVQRQRRVDVLRLGRLFGVADG